MEQFKQNEFKNQEEGPSPALLKTLDDACKTSDPLEIPAEILAQSNGEGTREKIKQILERIGFEKYGFLYSVALSLVVSAAHVGYNQYEQQEEEKNIETVIGKDLYETIKKEGGMVKFSVHADTSAKTLIHLGQMHATEDPYSNEGNAPFTIGIQKKIGKVLTYDATKTKNYTTVCLEGRSAGAENEVSLELEKLKTRLDGAVSLDEFQQVANTLFTARGTVYITLARMELVGWLTKKGFTFSGTAENGFEIYSKGTESARITTNLFLGNAKLSLDDEKLFAGAAQTLNHPRSKIFGCEDEEANHRPFDLEKEIGDSSHKMTLYLGGKGYKEIDTRYGMHPDSSVHNHKVLFEKKIEIIQRFPETAAMYAEIDRLNAEYAKATFSSREDIAVSYATRVIDASPEKYGYVVYGAAHNFSSSVSKYNQQNPNNQYNLISVQFIKFGA